MEHNETREGVEDDARDAVNDLTNTQRSELIGWLIARHPLVILQTIDRMRAFDHVER